MNAKITNLKELEAILVKITQGYRQSQSHHTFANPVRNDGTRRNYYKILTHLNYFGETSKNEIIADVWSKDKARPGWGSSIFGGLRDIGLIEYSHSTRMWKIGPKAKEYFIAVENFGYKVKIG